MATTLPKAGTSLDQSVDPYHSFRFLVWDESGFISSSVSSTMGGFSGCTLPEQNIDHIEYSEGGWTYSKFFPGRSTFSTVMLSRGIVSSDTRFAAWVRACAEGKDYRTNVTIVHLHRADLSTSSSSQEFTTATMGQSRKIVCYNCVPIRFRPGHDFDSMSSDISIQEIEFQPEYFRIKQGTPGSISDATEVAAADRAPAAV